MTTVQRYQVRKIGGGIGLEELEKLLNGVSEVRLRWSSAHADYRVDKKIVPLEGSALGILAPATVCSTREFREIVNTATELIVLRGKGPPESFHYVTVTMIPNFSRMISDLEKVGFVSTEVTQNVLSVDGRKFTFLKGKRKDQTYEVDSLGTTMFEELSKFVQMKWRFKVPTE